MDTKNELKILFWMIVVFVAVFFMPLGSERFMTAVDATFDLAKWYAQEHVVLCLLPAFFMSQSLFQTLEVSPIQNNFCTNL